ncbi:MULTISPECIES: DUF2726 domain-containing protein [unclassified Acinetobacter]|uniref:DUF2726 domain-containing protein n=1 Tax=unclassified Acinetobacter TaxID=196816 RepID=UPI0002D12284|nr:MULTISPECIES: DUF2726 domain-containing protein [unclassified Acinetobacter]ENU79639.1 hypothetical protein F975_02891 [Acinetobacter sp. ANC 3789]TCB85029.1 DUF2726 domain-containing protein [Acinetobacter sp. ANC 3791]
MIELISLSILSLLILLVFGLRYRKRIDQHSDSALKQRALLNYNEQIIYQRLTQLLPQHIILSNVSYRSLLTSKYSHTREKFNNMTADFVILNSQFQAIAIISLCGSVFTQHREDRYEDALLEMAGYRVIRYAGVPDLKKLSRDLNIQEKSMAFA